MSSNCVVFQAPPQAPQWKTVLLLHFEEAANATTVVSAEGKVGTCGGTAKISTGVVASGRSLVCPAGSHVALGSHTDFVMGTGDFTLELWISSAAVSSVGEMTLISLAGATQAGGIALAVNTATNKVMISDGAGNNLMVSSGVSDRVQDHIAYSRKNGIGYLFINGTLNASAADARNYTWSECTLGQVSPGYTSRQYIGYMDEVRITKGLGRYNGNFAPSAPLSL